MLDFVLTYVDGASLIYTSNSVPNSLPTLLHSTLGIHSLLKKQTLKHNVVDRDKVLVPPNWDSWGKIRVLREGFDVEGISGGWSNDIHQPLPPSNNDNKDIDETDSAELNRRPPILGLEGAVLPKYESTITDPRRFKSNDISDQKPGIEVSVQPNQEFLAVQLETINQLQAEEEKAATKAPAANNTSSTPSSFSNKKHDERVNEHIGPVQVNMGGIQVDAEDMLKNLKNRERDKLSKTPEPSDSTTATSSAQTPDEQKVENERLSSFFANLAKRGVSGSPRNTPGRDGRAASGKETPSKK